MRGPRTSRLAALATCLVVMTGGMAGERMHTVRHGESVSSIAKRYYGDFEIGELLLRYNDKTGTVIQPGEKLRIPYCDVHQVRPGDTWSGLAQRYLGRTSVYPAIATLNGIGPGKPLRLGDRIVIPVVLSLNLERDQTLALLAERFYGDAELGDMLQAFNRIDDPRRLSVGQTVQIPLVTMRLREATPAVAEPKEPAQKRVAGQQLKAPSQEPTEKDAGTAPKTAVERSRRFNEEIRAASEAFTDGEYGRARELLESLRKPVSSDGSDAEKSELWRLLTFVYVAFDLPDEACAAYQSLASVSSETKLDPDLVSPKIRRALSRCQEERGI